MTQKLKQFSREMNSDSQQMKINPNLDSHIFLVYNQPWFNCKKIDTTWINDFNASTSLALYRFYTHTQSALNISRRQMHKEIIEKSNVLVHEIEQELKRKN